MGRGHKKLPRCFVCGAQCPAVEFIIWQTEWKWAIIMTSTHPQPHQGFAEIDGVDLELDSNLGRKFFGILAQRRWQQMLCYFVFEIWGGREERGADRAPYNEKQEGPSFLSHLRKRKSPKSWQQKIFSKLGYYFSFLKLLFLFFLY